MQRNMINADIPKKKLDLPLPLRPTNKNLNNLLNINSFNHTNNIAVLAENLSILIICGFIALESFNVDSFNMSIHSLGHHSPLNKTNKKKKV